MFVYCFPRYLKVKDGFCSVFILGHRGSITSGITVVTKNGPFHWFLLMDFSNGMGYLQNKI